MIVNKYNSICHKQADLELYNVYGQEFYIGEFKKKSCKRSFLGLKEVKVSDLCISMLLTTKLF